MRKEYLILVAVAFVWGSGHPIGKIILREIHPIQLSMLSAILTSAALIPIIAYTKRGDAFKGLKFKGFALSALAGGIMFFIYPILSFSALKLIPASVNAILVSTSTIFVAIIAMAALKEKLNLPSYIGIALAFVGVPLVVLSSGGGTIDIKYISFFGSSLAIIGAIASASYTVIGRSMMSKYDALTVTLMASLSGAALQIVSTALLIGFKEIASASLITIILVLYWGIFSGLGYFFFYRCLEKLEAARASSFIYFSPVFAVLLSILILDEKISILLIIGMALIFAGVKLAQKK